MRKRNGILIAILLFVSFLGLMNNVKGDTHYVYVEEFTTDKTSYYTSEKIKINLTWSNFYVPPDYQAVRIEIRNSIDQILWNSNWMDNVTGDPPDSLSENWTIPIHSITNNTETLRVRVRSYYDDGGDIIVDYKATINIEILKRNVTCQVSGFQNNLELGENQNFNANFTDFENFALVNQLIYIEHTSDTDYSLKNDTTNEIGMINISLAINEMGTHFIKLFIKDDPIYNNSVFIYSFYVKKLSILYDLIGFTDTLYEDLDEDYIFKIKFYYIMNETVYFLEDYYLELKVFSGNVFLYKEIHRTDENGIIEIKTFEKTLKKNDNFNFEIVLNGTEILNDREFTLNVKIKERSESEDEKDEDKEKKEEQENEDIADILNIIYSTIFISAIFVLSGIVSFFAYKKKTKPKDVENLSIRY